ncbi:cysteine hydrolase [Streptomyces botrytidirepellens]|uniref:Cysteine hydrolase n=1 Tax=Streptomyces botrytidirepellens TaxID=2486417 RepID=A0A3M8WY73_9ACTN|nr:cysteine hydrolase [Streptomyces botrytidirepellens]
MHTALIVIDMINTYDHADAELLLPSVRETLPAVRRLVTRAREAGVEVIYVNDNFGRWRSHHDELLDTALRSPHADLVEPIRPDDDSLFVIKARHSIFYQTPLEYLLGQHGPLTSTCSKLSESVLPRGVEARQRSQEAT